MYFVHDTKVFFFKQKVVYPPKHVQAVKVPYLTDLCYPIETFY